MPRWKNQKPLSIFGADLQPWEWEILILKLQGHPPAAIPGLLGNKLKKSTIYHRFAPYDTTSIYQRLKVSNDFQLMLKLIEELGYQYPLQLDIKTAHAIIGQSEIKRIQGEPHQSSIMLSLAGVLISLLGEPLKEKTSLRSDEEEFQQQLLAAESRTNLLLGRYFQDQLPPTMTVQFTKVFADKAIANGFRIKDQQIIGEGNLLLAHAYMISEWWEPAITILDQIKSKLVHDYLKFWCLRFLAKSHYKHGNQEKAEVYLQEGMDLVDQAIETKGRHTETACDFLDGAATIQAEMGDHEAISTITEKWPKTAEAVGLPKKQKLRHLTATRAKLEVIANLKLPDGKYFDHMQVWYEGKELAADHLRFGQIIEKLKPRKNW